MKRRRLHRALVRPDRRPASARFARFDHCLPEGDAIVHTMLSFGFAGEPVTISIEKRKERGEACSSLAGFFRQYELMYVVDDEHDLFGVPHQSPPTRGGGLSVPDPVATRERPAPVPRPSGRTRRPAAPDFSQHIRERLPRPSTRSARPMGWRRQLGRERLAARSEQTLHLQAAWQPAHQGLIAVPVAPVAAC